MSDIPIIGQPALILFWYPTVILHCKCKELPSLQLIVITGVGNASVCGACGKIYVTRGFAKNAEGGLDPMIQTVLPTPKAEVM